MENFICIAIFIMTKIWDSKKSCFFLFISAEVKILLEKLFESTRTCVQKSNGYGRGINFMSKRIRKNYKALSTCFGIAFVFFYPCFCRFYWRCHFVAFCQILTFSKYQNLVLIKISLYTKIFPTKLWALKDSNAKNLSTKSPLNKKLQSRELFYF